MRELLKSRLLAASCLYFLFLADEFGESGFLAVGVISVNDVFLGGLVERGVGTDQSFLRLIQFAGSYVFANKLGRLADGFQGLEVGRAALDILARGFNGGFCIWHLKSD